MAYTCIGSINLTQVTNFLADVFSIEEFDARYDMALGYINDAINEMDNDAMFDSSTGDIIGHYGNDYDIDCDELMTNAVEYAINEVIE